MRLSQSTLQNHSGMGLAPLLLSLLMSWQSRMSAASWPTVICWRQVLQRDRQRCHERCRGFYGRSPPTGSQPSRAQKPALFSRITVVSELSRGSSWSFSHWAPGAAPDRVSQATVMEANQWIMGRTEGRVSNWAAPGTESGEEALAGPDARRLGKGLHAASSSTGSSSVAASAIIGISHTGMETRSQCSEAGRGCQHTSGGIAPPWVWPLDAGLGLPLGMPAADCPSEPGRIYSIERAINGTQFCRPYREHMPASRGCRGRPASACHRCCR
jgi:hypothetical protein